jgi:magnesium-transporting ATPase (P-type)
MKKQYRLYNKTRGKVIGYYNTLRGVAGCRSSYYLWRLNANSELEVQKYRNGKWVEVHEEDLIPKDLEDFELK